MKKVAPKKLQINFAKLKVLTADRRQSVVGGTDGSAAESCCPASGGGH